MTGKNYSYSDMEYSFEISDRRRFIDNFISNFANNFANFIAQGVVKHWLAAVNTVIGFIVGLALFVPILEFWGFHDLAARIFITYHLVCDQIPSHSFYILGHQVALCSRNFSLYFSMFLGGITFAVFRKNGKPLDWRIWMLCVLPIALDGGTQMFGLRESTMLLRILTGTLFGFGTMWFILPNMEMAIKEIEQPGFIEDAVPVQANVEI